MLRRGLLFYLSPSDVLPCSVCVYIKLLAPQGPFIHFVIKEPAVTNQTRSYASNEELVAKASGGLAMYGMNFFPTTEDIVIKPYAPLLQNPSFVEM